jgi:putative copper export protein
VQNKLSDQFNLSAGQRNRQSLIIHSPKPILMNILKRILLLILALVALMLIVAVFVRKEYSLEHETTVNKTKSEVFDYA